MIVKVFDNGWGSGFRAKQFEKSLVDQCLRSVANDQSKTVVINSVWYTQDYHEQVMAWCGSNDFDRLVLVAMLDAAIPSSDRFRILDRPVSTLGYYPGPGYVDFWALFVDKFFVRPAQHDLLQSETLDLPFMCLNRKPHWHRVQLYDRLKDRDLLDRGLVSLGGEDGKAVRQLPLDSGHDDLAPNHGTEHHGIANDIVSLGHINNWQRCFLNVVTETVYDINRFHFVSEKIYKPIIGCRPFLVYDPDGAKIWLHDRGFESYINDFHDISDLDLSVPGNMAPFLQTLCDQPEGYLRQKFIDLREKILHNKSQFDRYVAHNLHTIQEGIVCQI